MEHYKNIWDYQKQAKKRMSTEAYDYLDGAADDHRTFHRNIDIWQQYQIRPRRLVDVRQVDTSVQLFGTQWASPIIMAPVGMQRLFHEEGEIASAKAAEQKDHLMIASTVSSHSYLQIAQSVNRPPWFQLYPTGDREVSKRLLRTAEEQGCEVIVLTVDVPVPGNRESHLKVLTKNMRASTILGNFPQGNANFDASLTWGFIAWLRAHCSMKILLKGIMTAEDAALALEFSADGIVVSNHGGRQLESDLSTAECLEEIVDEVKGRMPILVDGGIRRGTDIFKALAMGADAVCIGRPYIYGLGAEGQKGVEGVLELLLQELVRNMKIAGVTSLDLLNRNFLRKK